jgi:membrane protease YdiL (CAAX protease family)
MALRIAALLEVLAVSAAAYIARSVLHRWGAGFAAGVGSTILAVLLATLLLRWRGNSWSRLGFRRPARMGSALLWTVALFLASMLIVPPVVTVISDALNFPAQHLDVFARLRGNPALYLVLLIPVSWGSAAFGEELICRGFILRRLCDALGGGRGAQLGAVLGQAALFGCAHAYLGPRGMLNAGALGLLAGLCYLMNGRNLWPLILAHGLVDTVGMTVLFLGLAHG